MRRLADVLEDHLSPPAAGSLFLLVVFGIGALKMFDQPFLVGNGASGAPNYSTMYPLLYIYLRRSGPSRSASPLLPVSCYLVIIFVLTLIQRLTVAADAT